MKTSQRSLIMASLVVLAIALSSYCLDYQTREAYRVRDQLFEPNLLESPPLVASPVLIKFGEAIIEPGSVPHVAVSGLYPRGNMTPTEAAIGGLLAPFLLLVAAGYLGLGASSRAGRGAGAAASTAADASPPVVAAASLANQKAEQSTSSPAADASEFMFRVAIVAAVIFPVLFVLDLPSLMLLSRLRFPRSLFALLVLRALARS
jgi:hypothetical protein